jgi:broad specificity phosphatase PhoE
VEKPVSKFAFRIQPAALHFGYSYGSPSRQLPRRIVLVRHGESYGNVDESEYTRTPDSQIRLTRKGHEQASEAGQRLKAVFDADGAGDGGKAKKDYNIFFYISPYRRSKETALGIAQAFESSQITVGLHKLRIQL